MPQNALTYFNRAVSTVKVQSVTAKRRFDMVEVWGRVHNTYTTVRRPTIALHTYNAQPVRCMSLNLRSNVNSNCNRHPYDDRMRDVYQKSIESTSCSLWRDRSPL